MVLPAALRLWAMGQHYSSGYSPPPLKPHTFCYDPLRWAPVLAMMLRRHGSDLDPDLLVKVVQAMQGLLQVRRLV